ncbi:hypothetical protein [Sphingobacterium faecium]|uniref:hypothetical protein n=1 Tax=Sphingobacterium faecium TaxID=34087 RepID=UPI0004E5FAB8|nr:hypothetical protein [Sphingobacterium faecium]UXD71162.1 hypothetical protein MUK51_07670 [Sphingobacterium faecium]WGQ14809.1 hypothetical protein QG727_00050 [Sphingobacterium faecium]CDT04905.1 exported hypothetical protein [Sphingobacterium sp. PM2-P1-29]SJN37892.1 hypothetical protein FM120_10870 [Sphingobacterium faecium PCAi_F2.5]
MKKLTTLLLLIMSTVSLYSQEKVVLSHTIKISDMIEISLALENKPYGRFHLIKIDTLTTTNYNGQILQNNFFENIFRRANVLARYNINEHKKYRNMDIKGVIKYFKPSANEKSYFNLGKLKDLEKNMNLIDNHLTKNNSTIYFGIVDSVYIQQVFPDFKYKLSEEDDYKGIDFESYDLMYVYKSDINQDVIIAVNEDLDHGYNNLTLTDKKTNMIYKLIKLKRNMTADERDDIKIELMIENESSIERIPFDFKNVVVK